MRRMCVAVLAGLSLPLAGGVAQDSLCNPCVDVPSRFKQSVIPGAPDATGQYESTSTTIIRAEDMARLGVVSLAEMVAAGNTLGLTSSHFRFTGDLTLLPAPLPELAPELDRVYEYVSARTGLSVSRLITVIIMPINDDFGMTQGCPRRGVAVNTPGLATALGAPVGLFDIGIFGEDLQLSQLLGVLAHEVAHVLMFEWLGSDYQMTGPALGEGYATWAGGQYVTDWYGIASLQGAVTELIATGAFLPPDSETGPFYSIPPDPDATSLTSAECFERRDRLYAEWGAFVEYLAGFEGSEGLLDLLHTVPRIRSDGVLIQAPSSPWGDVNYSKVYERDLAALMDAWLLAAMAGSD